MEAIMKKILALLVCVLMLFSLVACADDNGNADEGKKGVVDDAADKADEGTADEGVVVDDADDAKGDTDAGNGENIRRNCPRLWRRSKSNCRS